MNGRVELLIHWRVNHSKVPLKKRHFQLPRLSAARRMASAYAWRRRDCFNRRNRQKPMGIQWNSPSNHEGLTDNYDGIF